MSADAAHVVTPDGSSGDDKPATPPEDVQLHDVCITPIGGLPEQRMKLTLKERVLEVREFLNSVLHAQCLSSIPFKLYVDGKMLNDFAVLEDGLGGVATTDTSSSAGGSVEASDDADGADGSGASGGVVSSSPRVIHMEMKEEPWTLKMAMNHVRNMRVFLTQGDVDDVSQYSDTLLSHFTLPEFSELIQALEQEEGAARGGQGGGEIDLSRLPPPPSTRKPLDEKREVSDISRCSLSNFFPPRVAPTPSSSSSSSSEKGGSKKLHCVKDFSFSGWNPPPPERVMQGDLFYVEVVTLEDKRLFITCGSLGFFINRSTADRFDPRPADSPHYAHHIVGVLSASSKAFKTTYARVKALLREKGELYMAIPNKPHHSWVRPSTQHTFSTSRADEARTDTEIDLAGPSRDWNSEYQQLWDMPVDDAHTRILRDQALVAINTQFVMTCLSGARAVVQGELEPLNPQDSANEHMYTYANLFLMKAKDYRGLYSDSEHGDELAYKDVATDLAGVRAVNGALHFGASGLHTVMTCIVDYKGHRITGQSIIPGALSMQDDKLLVYGSMDGGATIKSKDEFHAMLSKVADKLHLKSSDVEDGDGERHQLCMHHYTKGVAGTDGRNYLLEIVASPKDSLWCEEFPGAVIRPELVAAFVENRVLAKLNTLRPERMNALKKGIEDIQRKYDEAEGKGEGTDGDKKEEKQDDGDEEVKKGAGGNDGEGSGEKADGAATPPQDDAGGAKDGPVDDEKKKAIATERLKWEWKMRLEWEQEDARVSEQVVKSLRWNANAFSPPHSRLPEEDRLQDEADVRELSSFLVDEAIPRLVLEFTKSLCTPVDGSTLKEAMHKRGINMRYLGRVAKCCDDPKFSSKATFLKHLCVQEMITRRAKYILNRAMRDAPSSQLSAVVARFLNCVFCSNVSKAVESFPKAQLSIAGRSLAQRVASQTRSVLSTLTTALVWSELKKTVRRNFRFELPSRKELPHLRSLSFLRSMCMKSGLTLRAKHYNFSSDSLVFSPEDVVDVFPIIKQVEPVSQKAHQLYHTGKALIAQSRTDHAYACLMDALHMYSSVYGPVHEMVAQCYSTLSMLMFHSGSVHNAILFQRKAVTIFERVKGLDHPDTASAYGNLAAYCRSLKHNVQALKYFKRAHFLNVLASGDRFPSGDAVTTYSNLAMVYQELGENALALRYFLKALHISQEVHGKYTINTANLEHHVAYTYGLMESFTDALVHEKICADIVSQLGDVATLNESRAWLKQFTGKAVQAQLAEKRSRKDGKKKLLVGERLEALQSAADKALAQDPSNVQGNAHANIGERSVSEILSFINDGSPKDSSHQKKSRKSGGGRKKRGGRKR